MIIDDACVLNNHNLGQFQYISEMEKTLASLANSFSPLGRAVSSPQSSTNFFNSVSRCRSQRELDGIVKQEVTVLEQRLGKPVSQSVIRESLVRCIYCHLLGYNVSFSVIHSVKLAQQGQLLHKRLGYLACCLLLEENDDLAIMLINTIQKDLQSSNVVDVLCGLTAASYMINQEMIPTILPYVINRLQHPKVPIRKRAVICIHGLLRKAPELVQNSVHEQMKMALCDKSPDVMWPAVHVYHDLIQSHPDKYRDVTRSLVFILRQIVGRKLPPEFDHHDVPAPWLQISLLQCLSLLGRDNNESSGEICPVLDEVLQKVDPHERIGLAVIHECVQTITTIQATPELIQAAVKCLTKFLSAKAINLKYLGLKLLSNIVKLSASYALPHQTVVIQCLDHPDLGVRRKVLDVLFTMTNSENVKVVCQKLMENLQTSADPYTRSDILNKLLQLTQSYSTDILWYVNTMNSLILLDHGLPNNVPASIMTTIRCHGNRDVNKLDAIVTSYWSLMRTKTLPDCLLRVSAWVVGEYFVHSSLSVPDIQKGLYNCLTRETCTKTTCSTILSALVKVLAGSNEECSLEMERVGVYVDVTEPELRQRLTELELLSSQHSELLRRSTAVLTDPQQFDGTLSVLDDYVCACLESGAAPYKPHSIRQSPAPPAGTNVDLLPGYSGVNFRPYESPLPSLASSMSGRLDPSLSSGSCDNKLDDTPVGLPSVQKIWNRDGVSRTLTLNGNSAPPTFPEVVETEEEAAKRELASALFTGITQQIESLNNV